MNDEDNKSRRTWRWWRGARRSAYWQGGLERIQEQRPAVILVETIVKSSQALNLPVKLPVHQFVRLGSTIASPRQSLINSQSSSRPQGPTSFLRVPSTLYPSLPMPVGSSSTSLTAAVSKTTATLIVDGLGAGRWTERTP
jgi:hypothetical protein